MLYFMDQIPKKTIFCTTMESDKNYPGMSGAPKIAIRQAGIKMLKVNGCQVMVTVEPVLDFDILELSSFLISFASN